MKNIGNQAHAILSWLLLKTKPSMNRRIIYTAFCFTVTIWALAIEKPKLPFNETYRPQYHFSAPENQMGSPVALFYLDSSYHLIFQHNPFNLLDGYIHWGHAVSPNLFNWKHRPLLLSQPDTASAPLSAVPWWGSVVFANSQLVCYFNRHQVGLFSGTYLPQNENIEEILISNQQKFLLAEPFVFWHHESQLWVMLAYSREESLLRFYNSSSGKEWNLTGTLSHPVGFPSLHPLQVDRKPDIIKWVLFGEKGTYCIGRFDGKVFVPESELKTFDGNSHLGGSVALANASPFHDQLIMVSTIKSENHPDLPSNGQLTLPFTLSLKEGETGIELYRKPVEEIKQLFEKATIIKDKKIYPGLKNNVLAGLKGDSFYFKMKVNLHNSDYFGLLIRCNKAKQGTELGYNVTQKIFSLAGIQISYQPIDKKMELEIFIDRSSIEVFIDGGKYVISTPFTPDPASNRYELFTNGGEIIIEQLEICPVRSIWR